MIILILVGYYLWQKKGNQFLESQVLSEIERLNFQADSIDVSYDQGRLTLYNLDLVPLLFSELENRSESELDIHARIDTVDIFGIDWWNFKLSKSLKVDSIHLRTITSKINAKYIDSIDFKQVDVINSIQSKSIRASFGKNNLLSDKRSNYKFSGAYDNGIVLLKEVSVELSDFEKSLDYTLNSFIFSNLNFYDNQTRYSFDAIHLNDKDLVARNAIINGSLINANVQNITVSGLDLDDIIIRKKAAFETVIATGCEIEGKWDDQRNLFKEVGIDNITIQELSLEGPSLNIDSEIQPTVKFASKVYNIKASSFKAGLKGQIPTFKKLYSSFEDVEYKSDGLSFEAKKSSIKNKNLIISDGQIKYESQLTSAFKSIEILELDLNNLLKSSILNSNAVEIELSSLEMNSSVFNTLENDPFIKSIDVISLSIKGSSCLLKTGNLGSDLFDIENFIASVESFQWKNKEITIADYNVIVNNVNNKLSDGLHKLSIDKLESTSEFTSITKLNIKPLFTRNDFKTNKKRQNTLFNVSLSEATLKGQVEDYFLGKTTKLIIDEIIINGGLVNIYTDETISKKLEYKYILSESVKNIGVPFYIKKLRSLNTQCIFEMLAKDRNDTSVLDLDKIDLVVMHVGNDLADYSGNKTMSGTMKSRFMNSTYFNLDINFDMRSKDAKYNYSGELGPMDLTKVNRLLEDLTAMKMRKGTLEKLSFQVDADKFKSIGTMEFYYQNLKMKHVEERGNGLVDPLKLIVNKFVLRQNNRENRHPKDGKIKTERNLKRSMFFHIWESVFDGIKSVLIPSKPLQN